MYVLLTALLVVRSYVWGHVLFPRGTGEEVSGSETLRE